ncbi:MAG: ABC transporter ATP-binding protein [Rubellimicrobium sp.]|nr:ABC transporter ATP-binding protein [Rubellimicrobium sp.]
MNRLYARIEGMVSPFAEPPPGTPPATPAAFIWRETIPFRRVLIIAGVLGAVVAALELGLIWYAGRLVDLMTGGPATFWQDHRSEILLAAVLLLLIRPVLVLVNAMVLFAGISTNMLPQTRWRAHRHLLGQPVGFFQNDFAGRLSNRVLQAGLATEDTTFIAFEAFWQAIAFALATLILLIGLDVRLAIPFFLWIVTFAAFVWWYAHKVGHASERNSAANSRVTARVVDSYSNIETVKLFSHAGREAGFARNAMARHRLRFGALMRIFATQQGAMAAFNSAAMVAVIGPALWLWTIGALSIGEVSAAIAMALRLNTMTGWIMWMTVRVFEHVGTLRESLESIAVPQTVTDLPGAAPLRVTAGEIRFQDVTHHYGKGRGGLNGVTLTIAPGERIGLVGRSGAGKSSLVNLLLRMRDAEGGTITIDGQDIRTVTQDSLRAAIGVVTQDSSLLHRSVRDNILYGRPDATEAQMIEAAEKAEAMGFIRDLRDSTGRAGFEARVGERGVKLSGGQRQRIALARVILKDAPILVLDEATSALDSEVEAAIQKTLYGMMEGKTVIAIAHRLSTIAQMDRIVVLDEGQVIEDGPHEALLEKGGIYARLWSRQSGGFLGDETVEAAE